MTEIFIVSILAGIVLGAPVGVAGAMVADAALAHNRVRLYSTILAAVAGDTTLAYVSSLGASPLRSLLGRHAVLLQIGSALTIIVIGILMVIVTALSHQGMIRTEQLPNSSKWVLGHTAPAIGTFILTIFHPGSIIAFLGTVAILSSKFQHFGEARGFFTIGIFIGSTSVFAFSGFLFWTIRKKADRFVYYLRYGLAAGVLLLGVYLLADKAILQNFIQG
ncbi:MAG: hypothetical protein A2X49_00795 [Lentisphaerae bacterium GWF2_52_8]|nr:MAG: hypothetical protein A2X49_00795 [Lentisphaerae bacterium GWF2_52_8]